MGALWRGAGLLEQHQDRSRSSATTCTGLRDSGFARAVVDFVPEVLDLFFKRHPMGREVLGSRVSFHFQPFSSRDGVCQGASEDGKQLQANHQPGGKSTCP